jgi:ribosome recycling factor
VFYSIAYNDAFLPTNHSSLPQFQDSLTSVSTSLAALAILDAIDVPYTKKMTPLNSSRPHIILIITDQQRYDTIGAFHRKVHR